MFGLLFWPKSTLWLTVPSLFFATDPWHQQGSCVAPSFYLLVGSPWRPLSEHPGAHPCSAIEWLRSFIRDPSTSLGSTGYQRNCLIVFQLSILNINQRWVTLCLRWPAAITSMSIPLSMLHPSPPTCYTGFADSAISPFFCSIFAPRTCHSGPWGELHMFICGIHIC